MNKKSIPLLFALCLTTCIPQAAALTNSAPELSAVAVYAERPDDQVVLFEREADTRIAVASLAKLMTGILICRHGDPADNTIISPYALSQLGRMGGFVEGEEIAVEHVLALTLIESSNDGATALAEYLAAKKGMLNEHDDSESDPALPESLFVELMNREADAMALSNTRFANPHGLDADGGYISARDAAQLFKEFLRHPLLEKFAGTIEYTCASVDGTVGHHVKNTNLMLDPEAGILAGKTGTTRAAGEHLVVLWQPDDSQPRHILVLLGSTNRYADMNALIEWLQPVRSGVLP